MKYSDVLTNEIYVYFDDETKSLLIHSIHNQEKDIPIRIKLDTLLVMDRNEAVKWVGEILLLLIPTIRNKIYHLHD